MLLKGTIIKNIPLSIATYSFARSKAHRCLLHRSPSHFSASSARFTTNSYHKIAMKEAIVHPGPKVQITDSSIPSPGPDDVVIKVKVSGCNPKDWKRPEWSPKSKPINQGDDIAGIVHSVGEKVTEFKPGDRVAAFHQMGKIGGSYAEYGLAPAHTTFHIPTSISYEEAATIPLAAMTAAIGLYVRLGLPEPWQAPKEPLPLVVYGAAGAVGAYVVQLAQRSKIHPLICIAGRGIPFVETLIDKSAGDTIIDYREGDAAVVDGIKKALQGKPLMYAYDAVSEKSSYANICKVLSKEGGTFTHVLPIKDGDAVVPKGIQYGFTGVASAFAADRDFAFAWYRLMHLGLKDGWFKAHPQEVVPEGLNGIQTALQNLKDGKNSASKYVFRIEDTPGLNDSKL